MAHGSQESVEFRGTVIKPTTSNSPRWQPNVHVPQPAVPGCTAAGPLHKAPRSAPPSKQPIPLSPAAHLQLALQEALPAPMVPGNYERRSSACLLQRAFEAVVVKQKGFEW